SAIATTTDRSGQTNGHRTESESKLVPSEPISPAAHVNRPAPVVPPVPVTRTVMPAAPSRPMPVFNGNGHSNGNGHNGNGNGNGNGARIAAVIPPAVTPPAPSPVAAAPVMRADVMTEMIAAVGTLRDAVDHLQTVLQGFAGQAP